MNNTRIWIRERELHAIDPELKKIKRFVIHETYQDYEAHFNSAGAEITIATGTFTFVLKDLNTGEVAPCREWIYEEFSVQSPELEIKEQFDNEI